MIETGYKKIENNSTVFLFQSATYNDHCANRMQSTVPYLEVLNLHYSILSALQG